MRNLLFPILAALCMSLLASPAAAQTSTEMVPSYLRRNDPPPQFRVTPQATSRSTPRSRMLFDSLYNGRSRRNPVEAELLRQGYDVAGKLPILPLKPDIRIRDAAGNVLPSRDPARNLYGPTIGGRRSPLAPLMRNRLSPSEIGQQQLYRGPSRPGMIAPRAQQERTAPSARELNRRTD